MKTIGHISEVFLKLTETFVYQQIVRNPHYNHVVFTKEIRNQKLYPVEHLVIAEKKDSLIKLLALNRIDVIHAHFGPNALFALPAKKKLGIPMLTFFHGYDVRKYPNTKSKHEEYRELFVYGEAFAVPSRFVKKELVNMGCPENKIHVCYLGIDIQHFPFKARKLDSYPINLISVGRLVDKKGHHILIEALSLVEKSIPNFHLSIIGEGGKQEKLKDLSKKLGLTKKISFLGALPPDKILKSLHKSHLFCLASLTCEDGNMEGLPISILEAQATGLPVISTKHSGIPEGVVQGQSAFLAEENNAMDLANKLIAIMSQPEIWPHFGRCGREWVVQNFQSENQMQKLNQLYEQLIGP